MERGERVHRIELNDVVSVDARQVKVAFRRPAAVDAEGRGDYRRQQKEREPVKPSDGGGARQQSSLPPRGWPHRGPGRRPNVRLLTEPVSPTGTPAWARMPRSRHLDWAIAARPRIFLRNRAGSAVGT